MSEGKIYPHANHRQRVRNLFRQVGADTVSDRGLLEMILFYSVPRRDTNELAARLLEKYGNLKSIFDAPYEELLGIEGIGESSALLLTIMPGICRRYSGKDESKPALFEYAEAEKYVSELFADCKNEEFYIICLDALGRAKGCRRLATGSPDSVSVDKRAILETAFEYDADYVILAHNHPNGQAAPSPEDAVLTSEAARLLGETGIQLADHIICGTDDCLSMASTAKFKYLFTELTEE